MPAICFVCVIPVATGITWKTVAAGIYDKKSSLFHITRQFYSFLGGCLTYLTTQLYFDGVQTRRMPKKLSVNFSFPRFSRISCDSTDFSFRN